MADVQGAHLVGSAPVDEPTQLFELVGDHLADHVRRVPDGEVGDRKNWIAWQYPKLAECPQLQANSLDTGYLGREIQQFTIVDGAGPVELVDLGYADAALDSWPTFEDARTKGIVPAGTRFMVGLPSPLGIVTMYVAPAARPAVFAALCDAMEGQLQRILDGIPADDLSIQWESCMEFAMLEEIWTYLDTDLTGAAARPGIADHLVHLTNLVPEPVEVGFHLCYGDAGHRHFTEPTDTGHLAWAMTIILDGATRPVEWIHLPVPRDREDAAYFAPLGDVDVPESTELYLGLVHATDGAEGTARRIKTAGRVIDRFGLATECGLGRRDLATVGELLDQHRTLSSGWAEQTISTEE